MKTYKITLSQLNELISLSYGNKEALTILKKVKTSNKPVKQNKKAKPSIEKLETKANKLRFQLIKNQTPQEVIFKAILKACKIEYEFQKVFILNDVMAKNYYVSDFYIPSLNIIFEIDGYYHYTKAGKLSDKTRDSLMKSELGIITYRICNSDTTDKVRCINKVNDIIKEININQK